MHSHRRRPGYTLRRIVYGRNVDGGAADELQRRIAQHPAILDDVARNGRIVHAVVIPLRVSSKMGIVFVTVTIEVVVRFQIGFPVVVHAIHCRAVWPAVPELLTGLWSGLPYPGSFVHLVAGTHPALAVQFPADKRILVGGSDRRQIALQTEECSRLSVCFGSDPRDTGISYKLVEVTVLGIRQSTPDRKLNRTRSSAGILTVIGIGDGAQSVLVRGRRSAAAETQDAGRSIVTS